MQDIYDLVFISRKLQLSSVVTILFLCPVHAPVTWSLAMYRDPLTGRINVTAFCCTALYKTQTDTRLEDF